MLETGVHATIGEIAVAERINPSYASRVLRLTLLASDVVEAILDGLLRPCPVEWERQRWEWGSRACPSG